MRFVYWFAYYDLRSPSVRYRGQYALEWMHREKGIGYRLIVPGYGVRALLRFITAYLSALLMPRKGSIIVVQRVRSGFIYATALKLLVVIRRDRTVFDLDDADYYEHDPRNQHWFMANCRWVSAGSDAIVRYVQAFNRNVRRVTSPIIDLGIRGGARADIFTIGWVGDLGGAHREGVFTLLLPAVVQLPFPVRLVILGVHHQADAEYLARYLQRSAQVELDMPLDIDWTDEAWLQHRIAGFDVGIATLLDTPVQTSKSGIKAKQYMNNGVPVLSTDLPENNRVVRHGHNGFYFSNVEALVDRLCMVHGMTEEERARLSENARATVHEFDHYHFHDDLIALITGEYAAYGLLPQRAEAAIPANGPALTPTLVGVPSGTK